MGFSRLDGTRSYVTHVGRRGFTPVEDIAPPPPPPPPPPPVGEVVPFRSASWITEPLASSPVLDTNHAAISTLITGAAAGSLVASVGQYGISMYEASLSDPVITTLDGSLLVKNSGYDSAVAQPYRNRAVPRAAWPAKVLLGGAVHQFVSLNPGTTSSSNITWPTARGAVVQDGGVRWINTGVGSGAAWGDNVLSGRSLRVPRNAQPAPGTDGHLNVIDRTDPDPAKHVAVGLWVFGWTGEGQAHCSWGSVDLLSGDGRNVNPIYTASNPWGTGQVSRGTGAGLSTAIGSVTWAEMDRALRAYRSGGVWHPDAIIKHGLIFATDKPTGPANAASAWRYPATTTDGFVETGTSIMEGMTFQLQATDLEIEAMPMSTAILARTARTYGARCTDFGGARVSVGFEYARTTAMQDVKTSAGLGGDFYALAWPWAKFKALRQWDGR